MVDVHQQQHALILLEVVLVLVKLVIQEMGSLALVIDSFASLFAILHSFPFPSY